MSEFKPFNLAEVYRSADAGIAQALQANMMVMQSAQMKREYDEEESLRTLARTSTSTDEAGAPQFDLKSFTKGAYGINPMKGLAFEKTQREAEKAALEKENLQGQVDERRMKTAAERLKVMNEASTVPFLKYKELLEGGMADQDARAKVQPMYEAAVRNVAMSGFFTPEQLKGMKIMQAPQFDPVVAETGMRQVLGAKDQLGEYWKGKDYGQKERHHGDSIEVQIRGQNITLRGQNLTDARAKEDLEQKGLEVKENEDGTYSVIDKKTREASPVLGQDGRPMVSAKSAGTQEERVAAGYASRMVAAEDILSSAAKGVQKPGKIISAVGAAPIVGDVIANSLTGDDRQKVEQAQKDWVRAKLRKESGAVIGPKEMEDEIKTYFPQIGDGEAVIKQKREARELAADGMVRTAGKAYKAPAKKEEKPAAAASFATEAEAAEAAKAGKIKAGDKITVGGKSGTWQD